MSRPESRIWSDLPAPRPARRIVAKLRTSTAGDGSARRGVAPALPAAGPRLTRLLDNARIRRVAPVLSRALAKSAAEGVMSRGRLAAAPAQAEGLVTIDVAKGEDPVRLARHLATLRDEVVYAYVPPPRRPFAKKKSGADPFLSRQWGHAAIRLDVARAQHGFVDGSTVSVAVLDSGIDRTHPDLRGAIGGTKNFVRGEGARDLLGHGTHVAGIIAATTNNGLGIAGVCAARILALKVLPAEAEWDAEGYYRALAYCSGRASVINISFGDDQSDPAERDLVADLVAAGVVVVAAMGNDFERGNPISFPAALPGVCAVGAVDHADRRWPQSCTGKHLSLCAPGVSVLSTMPTYAVTRGARDYDDFDGTSMAAPHVSAAAALLRAKDPSLTPAQVIAKLQRGATKVAGMKATRPDPKLGWGRLDIARALGGS